jgi:hypothetical protein
MYFVNSLFAKVEKWTPSAFVSLLLQAQLSTCVLCCEGISEMIGCFGAVVSVLALRYVSACHILAARASACHRYVLQSSELNKFNSREYFDTIQAPCNLMFRRLFCAALAAVPCRMLRISSVMRNARFVSHGQ